MGKNFISVAIVCTFFCGTLAHGWDFASPNNPANPGNLNNPLNPMSPNRFKPGGREGGAFSGEGHALIDLSPYLDRADVDNVLIVRNDNSNLTIRLCSLKGALKKDDDSNIRGCQTITRLSPQAIEALKTQSSQACDQQLGYEKFAPMLLALGAAAIIGTSSLLFTDMLMTAASAPKRYFVIAVSAIVSAAVAFELIGGREVWSCNGDMAAVIAFLYEKATQKTPDGFESYQAIRNPILKHFIRSGFKPGWHNEPVVD